MPQIVCLDNLRLAFWKACRGKRAKIEVIRFRENLEENLESLSADLLSGHCEVGNYHYFTIKDPKERQICAASFRERVLHHALMNVCEPILERLAIDDSYACRRGKGRVKAIERASGYAARHGWCLKMDIRKYFDSIDHAVLFSQLARRFKDPEVMDLFSRILKSYQVSDGKGLPIGNLTSQHFANLYLSPLDRFIKETLGCRAYLRYMDDFVVWGDSQDQLKAVRESIGRFIATELHLDFKQEPLLNRVRLGMDFLGYRLFGSSVRLSRRSAKRFQARLREHEASFVQGRLTEADLQARVTALVAFTQHADARGWRQNVIDRFGVADVGRQPREPWGQLEQQRQELPRSEPQQQQPGQQEQQYWVPCRPRPSSMHSQRSLQERIDPKAILSASVSCGVAKRRKCRPVLVASGSLSNVPGGFLQRRDSEGDPQRTQIFTDQDGTSLSGSVCWSSLQKVKRNLHQGAE